MKREDAEEFTQALGQIVAGSWRQIALAKRLGVPKALGLSTEQWVNERLGGYVRMAIPDRREAVKELSADGHSNVAIGEILGVDEKLVRLDKGSENSEFIQENASDSHNGRSENSEPLDAVAALAIDDQLRGEAPKNVRGTKGGGENEWFTPDEPPWPIITMARKVLGEIDLDPATHEEAQATVRATQYFTKEDDGLT